MHTCTSAWVMCTCVCLTVYMSISKLVYSSPRFNIMCSAANLHNKGELKQNPWDGASYNKGSVWKRAQVPSAAGWKQRLRLERVKYHSNFQTFKHSWREVLMTRHDCDVASKNPGQCNNENNSVMPTDQLPLRVLSSKETFPLTCPEVLPLSLSQVLSLFSFMWVLSVQAVVRRLLSNQISHIISLL